MTCEMEGLGWSGTLMWEECEASCVFAFAVVREFAWMAWYFLLAFPVRLPLLKVFYRAHIVRLLTGELGVQGGGMVECAPISEVSFLISSLVGSLPCSALNAFSHALTLALTCAMSMFGVE